MTVFRRILWVLGWGTAAGLIGAFLVGYAAPFLSPQHFWWTDLFAVFVPPLSLIVGGIALILGVQGAYRRRWGRVGLALGLLVLLALRFGTRLAAWGPVGPSGGTLQVMTLNVPPAFHRDTPNTALTTLVRDERPALLAFQESRIRTGEHASNPTVTRASASLRRLLDAPMGYAPPRVLPPNADIQQPVLGRIPLDSMSLHPLPPDGDRNARARYTRTRFTWQGRPAVLYNVHLHSVGEVRPWTTMPEDGVSLNRWRTFLRTYREGALQRARQARLIRRQIARETRPVIVVGDFNSTPHQWAYRHIARGLQSAGSQGVRGWTATFPAQRPLVRIDHVLAGPAWRVVAAQVPAPTDSAAMSDHRPVLARLRWRGQ